jgi:hypothetical protein
MTNRLAAVTSLYLLQHAENPVDWWEWGPEAFSEARRRNVPVLLSVRYAAYDWCHEKDRPTAFAETDETAGQRPDRGPRRFGEFRRWTPSPRVRVSLSCITPAGRAGSAWRVIWSCEGRGTRGSCSPVPAW